MTFQHMHFFAVQSAVCVCVCGPSHYLSLCTRVCVFVSDHWKWLMRASGAVSAQAVSILTCEDEGATILLPLFLPPSLHPSLAPQYGCCQTRAHQSSHTHTQLSLHWHCHFSTLISWWVQWSLPRFVKTHIFTHISTNTQANAHVARTHADAHMSSPALVCCDASLGADMNWCTHMWDLGEQ